jgi:HPt (histidine-containing phosphotransfer) domain-containing protein
MLGNCKRWRNCHHRPRPSAMVKHLSPADIAGLSISALSERVDGDASLAASILRRFATTQRGAADGLPALLGTDKAAALGRAHDLKGMLGNLGAEDLCGLAAALCELLRQDGPAPADAVAVAQQIERALPRLCDAVISALPPAAADPMDSEPQREPLPPALLAVRLDELAEWLRHGRAREAKAAVAELKSRAAGTPLQPLLEDVAALVAGYRLRDALCVLEQRPHG